MPDRFSRFDFYWIQTNKQTDKPNIYIEGYTQRMRLRRATERLKFCILIVEFFLLPLKKIYYKKKVEVIEHFQCK